MDGNLLYYGDNLDILKRYIDDESIDLIYLDPPFNSSQNYNVIFDEKNGSKSASQIMVTLDKFIQPAQLGSVVKRDTSAEP